jgi:hypothetical protein
MGGIWKSLEKQARKSLECWKKNLMDNYCGRSGDQNADSERQTHEDSGGNEDSIRNWTIGHSCYIVARICLHFVHSLRLCGRLSLTGTN